APVITRTIVPRYRPFWIDRSRRTRSQPTAIAAMAPDPRVMIATDPLQDALNGETLGDGPPPIIACPVTTPHATVATRATPVARKVRRQIGFTSGRRPLAIRDCPMRTAHTLPTPTSARAAMATCAGRINAVALPANVASAHEARR